MANGGGVVRDTIAAGIDKVLQRFTAQVGPALYRRGEAIMADSKDNYVPVDLGTLKGSGKVFPPETLGNTIRVTLSYGDGSTPYALAIHEHPSKHSPPSWMKHGGSGVHFSPSGTGPKYLERPMMAALPTLAAELAADIRLGV